MLKPLIAYVLLVGFLFLVNPNNVSTIFLVIPFSLLFVANYLLASSLLENLLAKRQWTSFIHRRAIALFIAAFPILLLILKSIGQLTLRDMSVMLVIVVLGCFYVVRSKNPTPTN